MYCAAAVPTKSAAAFRKNVYRRRAVEVGANEVRGNPVAINVARRRSRDAASDDVIR